MKDNVSHVNIHELEMKWLMEGSKFVFCCFGLEVNADKTKYVVLLRDQNVGRSHSIKTDNSSFAKLEKF
jgi:hypothetical protein